MCPVMKVFSLVMVALISQAGNVLCAKHNQFVVRLATSQQHHTMITTAAATATTTTNTLMILRGGAHVEPEMLQNTWDWCANLGAPAALVAGAVLATLIESRATLAPTKADTASLTLLKKCCRLLLLSSFGLEVVSIFVSTVAGTMLLSVGDVFATTPAPIEYKSPIGFLMHNFEFEFLTAHMCFLQGLFHWLACVALELLVPKKGEGHGARTMNRFISSCLLTIILGMLSFLNSHLFFYNNYANMWRQYAIVAYQKFFCPPTAMSYVILPAIMGSMYLGYKAFTVAPDEENCSDD